MTAIERVDTAKIDPCPGCGVPVRRFALTPVSGTGLDARPSGPWWCDRCIQAKCTAARAACRSTETVLPADGAML